MNRLVSKIEPDRAAQCECGKSLYENREEPGPDDWAKWLAGKSDQGGKKRGEVLEDVGWDEIDLLIISDTPVRKDSLYPKLKNPAADKNPEEAIEMLPAQHKEQKYSWLRRFTVGSLDKFVLVVILLLLASALVTFYEEFLVDNPGSVGVGTFVGNVLQVGVPLLLTAGLALALIIARRRARATADKLYALLPRSRWGDTEPWSYVKKIKLSDLFDMASLRVGSMSSLTSSIFMNRIRSLSYSIAYSREDLDQHVLTNQIFALENVADGCPGDWPPEWKDTVTPLSEDASAIVIVAAHMRTKLWINRLDKGIENFASTLTGDDPLTAATRRVLDINKVRATSNLAALTDLDVLVICGQLTTCYKLMLHAWRRPQNPEVFEKARTLWEQLIDDPAALVDERLGRAAAPAG